MAGSSNHKEFHLTYEGLKNLEVRLEYLKTEVRSDVAERIKQALAFGDISENSEYDEAKNEQARVESEIAEIEGMLKHVKIIDEDEIRTDIISLGNKVKLQNIQNNMEKEYTIVGFLEADPLNNKISDESPLGKALIGMKMGAEVEVQAPVGKIKYKILKIMKQDEN
jgi:transcription elongation factor GreA